MRFQPPHWITSRIDARVYNNIMCRAEWAYMQGRYREADRHYERARSFAASIWHKQHKK